MNKTQLYILKFGGTSIGTLQGINNVKHILLANDTIKHLEPHIPKLVIVSAATNSTNLLEQIYSSILNNNLTQFTQILNTYISHEDNLNTLLNINPNHTYVSELQTIFNSYPHNNIDKNKLKDIVLSFGETISMNRLYNLLYNTHTHKTIKKYHSWELGFITDSNHNSARLLETSYNLIQSTYNNIHKQQHPDIIITTGFIGKNHNNEITTLGRGGSDLSATLFAKALNPLSVQIWSDVPGIMTSDPRFIKNTRLINHMTYNEALELSFFGAKILHPETIEPILQSSTPLYILNTFDLNCSGTIITSPSPLNNSNNSHLLRGGISFNNHNTIISIEPKTGIITNHFLYNIFLLLDSFNINCLMISFSKTNLSICIKTHFKSHKLLNALLFNNSNNISIKDNIGIICVVSESLCENRGIASKIFSLVYKCNTNIEMISQSVSQTNVLFAIKQDSLINVVQIIHDNFYNYNSN
jgi:aspartate kinase